MLVPLKCICTLANVSKPFTEAFGIGDNCENVVVFVCVAVQVNVIVPLLLAELEVYFCL